MTGEAPQLVVRRDSLGRLTVRDGTPEEIAALKQDAAQAVVDEETAKALAQAVADHAVRVARRIGVSPDHVIKVVARYAEDEAARIAEIMKGGGL
jgi:hypothetical protein